MTTIASERQKLAAVGIRLITREDAGFRFDYTNSRPVTEPALTQHVHITITNPGNYSSDYAHARAVEAIGISRFPSTGVSYNRLVMQSGRIFEGQPIGRRGAHTVNDFKRATCTTSGCPGRGGSLEAPSWNNNITGRAYVICQNVDDAVTDAQVDSLARVLAADRLAGFVRRDARIHGHRCCSSKSCPGDRMWARMGELKAKVDHYLQVGLGGGSAPEEEDDMPYTPAQLAQYAANGDVIAITLSDQYRDAWMDFLEQMWQRNVVVRRTVNGKTVEIPVLQEVADAKTLAEKALAASLRTEAAVAAIAEASGTAVDLAPIEALADQLDEVGADLAETRTALAAAGAESAALRQLLQQVAAGQVTPEALATELAERLAD
jgi:hypothetical protein